MCKFNFRDIKEFFCLENNILWFVELNVLRINELFNKNLFG